MEKSGISSVVNRNNALGFVRLVLASLVIVSHTPEMIDGNRLREPLSLIFGTISFGEFAVDSFFVISGYLIVASYLNSGTITSYLKKRVARIFPGFVAASIITLIIVNPLAGGSIEEIVNHLPRYASKIVTLQKVNAPNVLSTLPIKEINSAVWTISYEFRCYLAVILFGMFGLLHRPAIIAVCGFLLMMVFISIPLATLRSYVQIFPSYYIWLGEPDQTLRLLGLFLIGSLFYLWRSRLRYTWRLAYLAMLGLIACLSYRQTAEVGVAVFGGYLIFGFAAWGRQTVFSKINNNNDISYGVYLYGWPIGSLLIYYFPNLDIVTLVIITIGLSFVFGYASWHLVEKPSLRIIARDYGLRSVQLPRIMKRVRRLQRPRLR